MTTARAGHVVGDHGAGGHEGLLADLDARHEHGGAPDPARAPQDRSAQLLVRRVAPHGVVVGGQDAGAEEDVVLDDAEAGHVDVGLDLDARADDDVVVDGRAAPDDAVGPDAAALAHEGLIADDRPRADVRAGEDDRPRAHRRARPR